MENYNCKVIEATDSNDNVTLSLDVSNSDCVLPVPETMCACKVVKDYDGTEVFHDVNYVV
jgi:hypothetical protein